MDTPYRLAWNKAFQDLQQHFCPQLAHHAGVRYDPRENIFIVPFLGREYALDIMRTRLYELNRDNEPAVGVGIMIMHYVLHAQDIPLVRQLISLKEVPNGGMNFYPAFRKNAIGALVDAFADDFPGFYKTAARLGGVRHNIGHAAVTLPAFPKVPVTLVLWEGDEEIAPAGNILFDASVAAFLPVEDIIGIGSYCVHEMIKLYCDPQRQDAMWG